MKLNLREIPLKISLPLGILVLCALTAFILIKLKPTPETREPEEPVILAHLIPAVTEDVVVTLTSHGVARPTRMVMLSSEVAGRVTGRAQQLDEGDRVEKGQTLLDIDATDYEAAVQEADASLSRSEATLKRLETTESTTRAQLKVSQRSRDLAKADFDRLTTLSKQGNAVSQAVAEAAERTLAQAESQVLLLEQTLELLPSQVAEAESEKRAAEARLDRATKQLERTRIVAPFDGRILRSMVEANSYVAPGTSLVELANDSEVEVRVTLQASELRKWIPFTEPSSQTGWFPAIQQIPVELEWTGSDQGYTWTGQLDRLVHFDATTRMATLAVIVSGEDLVAKDGSFPLTDGMFCRVRIPGKTLENVVALPREAVTFDNQAYLSIDGRLTTVDVTVAWATEDSVYVSEGIRDGDLVVGTRLVAPKEGIQLQDVEK